MSQWVRILLVLNTLFEYLVAIGSVVGGLLATPLGATQLVLGGNALGLGTLSLLTLVQPEPAGLRKALLVFAVFHSAVTLAWLIAALNGPFNPAMVVHGLFAAAFFVARFRGSIA